MDTSESHRAKPKAGKRMVLGIGLGLLITMLLSIGMTWSLSFRDRPGWLWPDREMTVTALFHEHGVALDDVRSYSIVNGVRSGVWYRVHVWKDQFYWKEPASWVNFPKVEGREASRFIFEPGSYHMAPELKVYPGDLVLWTHRVEPWPNPPEFKQELGGKTPFVETHFYSDIGQFSQYGIGTPPGGLLENNGGDNSQGRISETPPFERLESFFQRSSAGFNCEVMYLKVRDAKEWLQVAARLAQKDGQWHFVEWKGELEVQFGGGNAHLAISADEGRDVVRLEHLWSDYRLVSLPWKSGDMY